MSEETQAKFEALLVEAGLTDDMAAKLRAVVEGIESAAFERGQVSGASPFDGSWPE